MTKRMIALLLALVLAMTIAVPGSLAIRHDQATLTSDFSVPEDPAEGDPAPADMPAEPVPAALGSEIPAQGEGQAEPAQNQDLTEGDEPVGETPAPKPAEEPAEDIEVTSDDPAVSVYGPMPADTVLEAERLDNPFASGGVVNTLRNLFKAPARSAAPQETNYAGLNYLGFYDLKLYENDVQVQPDGTVLVTIYGVPVPESGSIQIIHILDDVQAIRSGFEAGTVTEVTEPAFVEKFPAEAQAAWEAVGAEETVYIETMSTASGTVYVLDESTIQFYASSFSIYAIVDDGGNVVTPRRTYHFENADGSEYTFLNAGGEQTSIQIIKTGDALQNVGVPSVGGNETFVGWFLYDKTTNTYGEQVEFGEAITVTESAEMTDYYVRPGYGTAYYISFYETTDDTIVLTRKQYLADKDGEDAGYAHADISTQKVNAPDAQLAFIGWSEVPWTAPTDPTTGKPDYSTDSRTPVSETNIKFNSDRKYYPVFRKAHWLYFVSAPVGTGATYVPPVFVLSGETTASARPEAQMRWTGYSFQYWTETPTVVDNVYQDSVANPPEYQFNEELSADKTLYAYWTLANTDYTISFYSQLSSDSVNANPKNYEYIGSVTRQSTKGATVNVTAGDRAGTTTITNANGTTRSVLDVPAGYSVNEGKSTLTGVVKADGSTALSVYFDRKPFTLTFRVNNTTVRTITELYGHSIQDYFPIQGTNGQSYQSYYWSDTGNPKTFDYILETLEKMPAANVTFAGTRRDDQKVIYYYVEVAKGESLDGLTIREFNNRTFKLYKSVTHDFRFLTYDEEYHPIEGFSRDPSYAVPYFGQNYFDYDEYRCASDGPVGSSSGCFGRRVQAGQSDCAPIGSGPDYAAGTERYVNYLYYIRNTHNLEFRDSNNNALLSSNPTQTVQYEENISRYQPTNTPISPMPGYTFKGWYTDSACQTPFNFDQNMPDHDVVVYAGWEKQWYRIEVDPAGGELHGTESTFFWLHYGEKVEQYGDVTRDYVQDDSGEFYYHYHPYSQFQEDDYTQDNYYSYWGRVANYDNKTTATHYRYDPNKVNDDGTVGGYVPDGEREDIYTADMTTKYRYEEGAYALVGWYKVNEDGTLGKVYNFDDQVTGNVKIRAVWRRVGEYHVRYDIGENGLSGPTDNNTYADQSDTSVLSAAVPIEGYSFVGWEYKGQIYKPGDVYQIDAEIAQVINGQKTVILTAVYREASDQPVEVTSITLDGNGGKFVAGKGNDDFNGTGNETSLTISNLDLNTKVTLLGEESFERAGYTLKGWAFTPDATTVDFAFNAVVGMDNVDRSSETTGNDAGNTLYAVWEESAVNIYYEVVGPGGQLTVTQEINIPAASGTVTGSTASVNSGYEDCYTFVGWFLDEACTQPVPAEQVSGNKFTPVKTDDGVYEAATYYAKFTENTVTIHYVAVGPEGAANFGSVSPANEILPILSGAAQGSTASASSNNFKFVGWYDNEECTGDPITTDEYYVPHKPTDSRWVDGTTYYAKFEYNLANLTITKQGADAADENQTFLFTVTGKEGTPTAGTRITVTIHGNGSVTISDLLIGDYTVTEVTDWSWRYDQTGMTYAAGTITNGSFTLSPDSANNIVTVTNTRSNPYWLSGDSFAVNVAGTGRKN